MMKMQSFETVSLLLVLCAVGRSEVQDCREDLKVQFVDYCDLVHNPKMYDGHLVRTEAVWQTMIHTGALADRRCSDSGSDLLLVLPSLPSKPDSKSSLRKDLETLLRKDGAARVRVTGTFRDLRGKLYSDGQRFQMEIKCLSSVTPLSPAEKRK